MGHLHVSAQDVVLLRSSLAVARVGASLRCMNEQDGPSMGHLHVSAQDVVLLRSSLAVARVGASLRQKLP